MCGAAVSGTPLRGFPETLEVSGTQLRGVPETTE
jgi:hypothetical protein